MGEQSSLQVNRVSTPPRDPRAARRPGPAIICLIFLLFGIVWNLIMLFLPPSAWKDWVFLAVAALLLYLLIRHLTDELSESEQLYRGLVENAGSIILTMDREGISFFNRRAEEVFGFRRGEVLGKSVIGTIVPATESSGRDLDQLIQEIIDSPGEYLVNRNENVNADGERVWVTWTNQAIRDGTGFAVGVVSIGTVETG
jgi:PAS domain S-box-containing protein